MKIMDIRTKSSTKSKLGLSRSLNRSLLLGVLLGACVLSGCGFAEEITPEKLEQETSIIEKEQYNLEYLNEFIDIPAPVHEGKCGKHTIGSRIGFTVVNGEVFFVEGDSSEKIRTKIESRLTDLGLTPENIENCTESDGEATSKAILELKEKNLRRIDEINKRKEEIKLEYWRMALNG